METFAQRAARELRMAVKARGFTHDDLARTLNVSPAYVQRRLSGSLPMTLDDLEQITGVTGLSVNVEIVTPRRDDQHTATIIRVQGE